jgi:hypothetical protein
MHRAILHSEKATAKLLVLDNEVDVSIEVKRLNAAILSVSHKHHTLVLRHRHAVRDVELQWRWVCWVRK